MDAKEFTNAVESYIRPATFPVMAKLLKLEEPLPEKAKRPWRDMKIQIATCQAIAMARRYGWTIALGEECLWPGTSDRSLHIGPSCLRNVHRNNGSRRANRKSYAQASGGSIQAFGGRAVSAR